MKKGFVFILLCIILVVFTAGSFAEVYPTKSLTLVVPYGAGGTTDLVGRQFGAALSKILGVSVVIENQPGASGYIGCQAVLDSAKDGSIALFAADSLGTQRVMGISELSYDDFTPIIAVANDPKVIVVSKDSPYNTIEDLLAAIKAEPNRIQMSYTGPGGSGHVQALIMSQFGYSPALTAYASGAECIVAVMSGQVVFTNSNHSTVSTYIESGDLKLLAVCANERMPQYPNTPALVEHMPGSEELLEIPYTPLSFLVANDVPSNVKELLRNAALEAVKDEAFNDYMDKNRIEKLYEKYVTIDEIKKFYSEWESTVSWLLFDSGAAAFSPEQFNIPRIDQ
ncbi:MAG: tripartite tricarboxylate transporter substrate binding protein [Christensenellaceae bacterium]|nr:tripartite tricarboxylate transporter substrate binding protein [Christensenellaceae bacterium]